jgi:hypothetical protein
VSFEIIERNRDSNIHTCNFERRSERREKEKNKCQSSAASRPREKGTRSREWLALTFKALEIMVARKEEKRTAFRGDKSIDFINAVYRNDVSVVVALLGDGRVNVNRLGDGGVTPFMTACFKGHTSLVTKLLDYEKVKVNAAVKESGITALLFAVDQNHEPVVAMLVASERVDVNAVREDGISAIFVAAYKGFVSIVAKLIECDRVDLNTVNEDLVSAVMIAGNQGFASIVDMLAEAGAILSSQDHSQRSLYGMVGNEYIEQKAAALAVLKKHGIISRNVPVGFQSKYYFQDGQGKFYTRNLKYQRWLNRRTLLLALYRTYQWSLDNQVLTDARRTLPPDLSGVGKFICQCWFDVAGGGKDGSIASDTLGNGIGRLIMQYYGGFDASKSHFALRGKPEYGKVPDNAERCSNCLAVKEGKALLNCASCGVVRYCGRECQKTDWKRHKYNCKIWAEEKKMSVAGGRQVSQKKGGKN